jgi:hypothetical protein
MNGYRAKLATRRGVLRGVLGIGAMATFGGADLVQARPAAADVVEQAARALLDSLGLDEHAAGALGAKLVTDCDQGRTDLARLVAALCAGAGIETEELQGADPHRLGSSLRAAIRRDFRAARTVLLDGWLLARTESQLYAAAALLSRV